MDESIKKSGNECCGPSVASFKFSNSCTTGKLQSQGVHYINLYLTFTKLF